MKRKGFTLVELLIVIVVIGILSAMMMLSSTEAVISAKANNIISDMRNFKTAAVAWYVDDNDFFATESANSTNVVYDTNNPKYKILLKYLSSKVDVPTNDKEYHYKLIKTENTNGNGWYIEGNIDNIIPSSEREAVKAKLAAKAKSVGLLNNRSTNAKPYGQSENRYDDDTTNKYIWIRAF